MKKILLVGNCPLPEENVEARPAAGLRTWQYLKVLQGLAAKGEIKLQSILIAMPECYGTGGGVSVGEDGAGAREGTGAGAGEGAGAGAGEGAGAGTGVNYQETRISKNDPTLNKGICEIMGSENFDAIVAVNTYPSFVVSGLLMAKGRKRRQNGGQAPLWCDLNGWIMAEGQAQAFKKGVNDYLPHYFEMEKTVLLAGDKFAAVSKPQEYAILGELAILGRIGRESFGYEFMVHVPNGTEDFGGEHAKGAGPSEPRRALEEKLPKEAFTLLWMGGYNTWADEHTLFKALEMAMNKHENLYFVSTGGGIKGLDDKTFTRFKEMIEGSRFKERFIFLGWVENSEIPSIYERCDIGINVDRKCLETSMGARNRINEMMKFGLPVITTAGSEIATEVAKFGAGIVAKSGDHEDLARAISEMYDEWRGGQERASENFNNFGRNGRNYIEEKCNYEFTLTPLLKWLKNPAQAPDHGQFVQLSGGKAKMIWRYLRENGFKKSFIKFWQKIVR